MKLGRINRHRKFRAHALNALEEIMAWYWQCDSDDPDLPKRMDSVITLFDTSGD